jgi:hypothetical protein
MVIGCNRRSYHGCGMAQLFGNNADWLVCVIQVHYCFQEMSRTVRTGPRKFKSYETFVKVKVTFTPDCKDWP